MSEGTKPAEGSRSLVLSEEELKNLKEKHGDIYVANLPVDGRSVTLAFRYPDESKFRFVVNEQTQDFAGKIAGSDENQGDRYGAQRRVLQECCLHPGTNMLDTIFKRYPGLVLKLWSKLEKAVTPNLEEIKNV